MTTEDKRTQAIVRWCLILAWVFCVMGEVDGQIPSEGSDFNLLSRVRWGMSLREVQDTLVMFHPIISPKPKNLRRDDVGDRSQKSDGMNLQEISDTALVFPIDLMDHDATATLLFTATRLRLYSASITPREATDELFQKALKTLETRHGPPSGFQKKQQTKLFFTFDFEFRYWKTETQVIALMTVLHNGSVKTLTIDYRTLVDIREE